MLVHAGNDGSKIRGATASVIDDSIGGTKEFKIKIRKQLIKDGLVETKKGPRNSDLYIPLKNHVAMFGSGSSTSYL